MGTTIRPELSENSEYQVGRHRYYELKHFCLQYPLWKQERAALEGLARHELGWAASTGTGQVSDPTAACVEKREFYSQRIAMVEDAARETDAVVGEYILFAIVNGLSYEMLRLRKNVPCGKSLYYQLYRRFFWLLDQKRG